MDPQTVSFVPQQDIWRLSNTIRGVQETQSDHAERLLRLERRQEEDARLKSVWGSSSPFPGVIGGSTPQTGPTSQPVHVDFANFDDDQSNNMIRSLQLDADEEPRRLGATSRANSVRFDESANQSQWPHTARSSVDYSGRSSSGLGGINGGLPLFERSTSHKSDGRHSSASHSAFSGRANSLGLDALSPIGPAATDVPGLAPGLFILGSVPSIIRCWLNTNFKHEALLYAAVCSGSYQSFLDSRLIEELGLTRNVKSDIQGHRKIKLSVYLPEAVPQTSTSRPSSPSSQLPMISVDFTVVENQSNPSSRAIKIFIGSDTLRAHNADILFSSNTMVMYDGENHKLSVPFVRPESDDVFRSLYTTSGAPSISKFKRYPEAGVLKMPQQSKVEASPSNGILNHTNGSAESLSTAQKPSDILDATSERGGFHSGAISRESSSTRATDRSMTEEKKPVLLQLNTTKSETKDNAQDTSPVIPSASRTAPTSASWHSWRREGGAAPSTSTSSSASGWFDLSKGNGNYVRPNRDQGIRVLKPGRSTSRPAATSGSSNVSTGIAPIAGPASARLPEEGKKRISDAADWSQLRRATSGDISKVLGKDPLPTGGSNGSKPNSSANPVGGASAFGWLNNPGQQKS